ncbi:MAG: hypothetical protein U9N77_03105 [Thermodesulfobacteriota bacterium]|nr:hypothetical protein [Thermodesulfobacteriota bacterium]
MLRKDLITKNPAVQIMGKENLHQGRFGAVLSRAGVGKTQFLVQIAISRLLNDEKIIHVSLNDQMDKINLRYKEAYFNLIDSIGYIDPQKAVRLWDDLDLAKIGIAYNESTFSPEKIRDYLQSLKKENLQIPAMLIIDGLNFDKDLSEILDQLYTVSRDFSISVWFSMRCHREESLCSDGFPKQLENVKEKFDKALFLKPKEDKIEAIILKDGDRANQKFMIDPATMMTS